MRATFSFRARAWEGLAAMWLGQPEAFRIAGYHEAIRVMNLNPLGADRAADQFPDVGFYVACGAEPPILNSRWL